MGCSPRQGRTAQARLKVSATAIRMLLRKHRVPPAPRRTGPTWREFIRAHAAATIATETDVFTLESVFLRTIYPPEARTNRTILAALPLLDFGTVRPPRFNWRATNQAP